MKRTQILFDDWQVEALKAASARAETSMSCFVREAVADYLARSATADGLEDVIGIARTGRRKRQDHDEVLYGRRRATRP